MEAEITRFFLFGELLAVEEGVGKEEEEEEVKVSLFFWCGTRSSSKGMMKLEKENRREKNVKFAKLVQFFLSSCSSY